MTTRSITPLDRPLRAATRETLRVSGGSTVLVTLDGTDHVLNGTAVALWELCDGTTTVDEMIVAVTELFGLPAQRSRTEVVAALGALAEVGLVCVA